MSAFRPPGKCGVLHAIEHNLVDLISHMGQYRLLVNRGADTQGRRDSGVVLMPSRKRGPADLLRSFRDLIAYRPNVLFSTFRAMP